MTFVRAYLLHQFRRFISFWYLQAAFLLGSLVFLFGIIKEVLVRALEIWNLGPATPWLLSLSLLGLASCVFIIRGLVGDSRTLTLAQVARRIEEESRFDKSSRGELRSFAFFLEETGDIKSHPFLREHEKKLRRFRRRLVASVTPQPLFYFRLSICLVSALGFFSMRHFVHHLPASDLAFSLDSLESLSPASDGQWQHIQGSLAMVEGTRLRYKAPHVPGQRIYLFEKKNDHLVARACTATCEWTPTVGTQMSVGSWLSRTAFMPLRVVADERAKSFLMAEVKGDFAPELRLKVRALASLRFRASASDDIEILGIDFVEKTLRGSLSKTTGDPAAQSESSEIVLKSWPQQHSFRAEWVEDFSTKKGGEFQYFLRLRDRGGTSESAPMTIAFIDDEELRKERALALRAMIDSWVHVLGDLIEVDAGSDYEERLLQNLKSISYDLPDETPDKAPLVAAFYGELQRLALRIERELSNSSRLSTLIQRVERQILYGLSLLYQEKVGSLEESQQNLISTRADLQSLLDKLKKGDLPLNSDQLKEAFKAVAEKIDDLQKKIQELPHGPSDDMINREALQNQLDESESLESRIAEIQKQIENGQSEAALKELESLLNQLSLLTKEMENSLGQWKDNFDKSSQAAIQNYQKSLDQLKKRQQDVMKESETLKTKIDAEQQQVQERWRAPQAGQEEKIAKEAKQLAEKESQLQKDFQEARESLEKQLGESEWKDLFRSEDIQSLEEKAQVMMQSSKEGLQRRMLRDSMADQQSVIDALRKIQESTQERQKQIQHQAQANQQNEPSKKEHIDVLSSENSSDKERRRKILDSMNQNVEKRYQQSHERYFEELLQR